VVTTHLAAHALPPEYKGRKRGYIAEVAIPSLRAAHAEGLVDAVDAFCEGIAFSPAEIARVFAEARALGLPVKLHAEQLSDLGGAALAPGTARCRPIISNIFRPGVAAMAAAGTVAVILPGAFYTLRETQMPPIEACAQARRADGGGDRLNPGTSPLTSLPAGHEHGLHPVPHDPGGGAGAPPPMPPARSALPTAAASRPGSADLAVWDADHPAELAYRIGFNRPFTTHLRRPSLTPEILIPGRTTLAQLERIWRQNCPARWPAPPAPGSRPPPPASPRRGGRGRSMASTPASASWPLSRSPRQDTATLQRNLILSHCCGVGEADAPRHRAADDGAEAAVAGPRRLGRALGGGRAARGMLGKGVTPVIPAQGSVGASGDLAPLAHMTAVMIGDGEAEFAGERACPAPRRWLAGLSPVTLGPRKAWR
jgi:hypothetical protein